MSGGWKKRKDKRRPKYYHKLCRKPRIYSPCRHAIENGWWKWEEWMSWHVEFGDNWIAQQRERFSCLCKDDVSARRASTARRYFIKVTLKIKENSPPTPSTRSQGHISQLLPRSSQMCQIWDLPSPKPAVQRQSYLGTCVKSTLQFFKTWSEEERLLFCLTEIFILVIPAHNSRQLWKLFWGY